jgi:phage-related protein
MTKAFNGNTGALGRMGIKTKQVVPDLKALASAQEAHRRASTKYADAVSKYGAGSKQAVEAQHTLALAADKVTAAQGKTKNQALSTADVMKQLNDTFGGQAAKAGNTSAGQMKRAQLAFKAFQVTLGQALMPVLKQLVDIFMKFLPILTAVTGWIKKNPGMFKLLAAGIIAVVVAMKLYKAATTIATVATALFNGTLALNPIGLIVVALVALIAGVIIAYKKIGWFRDAVDAVWQAIQTAFHAIVDAAKFLIKWLAANWPTVLAILTGPIGIAVLLIVKNWDKIKEAASAVVNWVKEAFGSLVGFFKGIIGGIASAIGAVADAIKAPINAVIGAWNSFRFPEFKLPKIDLGPLGEVGGNTVGGFGFPHIPKLETGGLIKSPGLAFLHAAEVVVPAAHTAGLGGPAVVIQNAQFGDAVDIDTFLNRVAWHAARSTA